MGAHIPQAHDGRADSRDVDYNYGKGDIPARGLSATLAKATNERSDSQGTKSQYISVVIDPSLTPSLPLPSI